MPVELYPDGRIHQGVNIVSDGAWVCNDYVVVAPVYRGECLVMNFSIKGKGNKVIQINRLIIIGKRVIFNTRYFKGNILIRQFIVQSDYMDLGRFKATKPVEIGCQRFFKLSGGYAINGVSEKFYKHCNSDDDLVPMVENSKPLQSVIDITGSDSSSDDENTEDEEDD